MPKTALITGTSRPAGLGFAVARGLAELGYHVVLAARNPSAAQSLATQLRQSGHAASAVRLDLSERTSMVEAADYLTRTFGHLDILINNASGIPDDALTALDADMDEVRSHLEVGAIGPWALTQLLLPLLMAAPAARIVNVTSVSAQQITAGLDLGAPLRSPAHSLSKYMLNALTSMLARALNDTPILINAVDPGNLATHPEYGIDDNDRPAAEAAQDVIRVATLDADGPTGCLFSSGKTVAI